MQIKKHIPNILTLGNLFCGCIAIINIINNRYEGDLIFASAMIGLAMVFDFFDGLVARLLKVSSAIGKDLDSLADMVSFGVVPGLLMYSYFSNAWLVNYGPDFESPQQLFLLPYLGFLITLFSALRLAKFNNDTRQSDSFIGLPTPANTMLIASIPVILVYQTEMDWFRQLINNNWFLSALTIMSSLMLVAEVPLFALKFKSFGIKGNELRYTFLGLSILLFALLKFIAIPVIIFLYVLMSLVNNKFLNSKA